MDRKGNGEKEREGRKIYFFGGKGREIAEGFFLPSTLRPALLGGLKIIGGRDSKVGRSPSTIVGDISLRLIDFTVITSLSPFGALKSFRSLLDNDDDLAVRSNLPAIRAGSSGFPLHFSPRHANAALILIVESSSSLYDPFSISPIVFGK